jgi:N-carbamoyl-L-amino-acid hydrolase
MKFASLPNDWHAMPIFYDLFSSFSECGQLPNGGVSRLCGTPADGLARGLFARALSSGGAIVTTDSVGNQFGTFILSQNPAAPLVMMGSHLDSQLFAGRFDGAVGVAAAAAIGVALQHRCNEGVLFNANFCAVNWTNEEGARFRPSLLGSGAFAGSHDVAYALSRADDDGVTLAQALSAIGYLGESEPPPIPACYLELHVEQGPILEEASKVIGVVTSNWGATKIDVTFSGERAHTGPTRMSSRRDALLAAAYLVAEIRELAGRWPGLVHTSVGRIAVEPNSSNVVASRGDVSLEIRSADDNVLIEATEVAWNEIQDAAKRAGVAVDIVSKSTRPIRSLAGPLSDLVEDCAKVASVPVMRMATVAGHDALSLLGRCPVGLVFIPSVNGIAHNEAEFTSDQHLEAGVSVLLAAADRLCRAYGLPETAIRAAGAIA